MYLKSYIRDHDVTDIVMLGDGRIPHATAAEIGMEDGIRVHILEHGYLRPDWLTIEPDGMSAHSRFPREPHAIETLAAGSPAVAGGGLYQSSFLTYALYDLAYHIPNVLFGWLVHPHYRTHGPVHPMVEYGGWIWKALTAAKRRRAAEKAIADCLLPGTKGDARFFLFPLQLPGDYQIRSQSPGGDLFKLVDAAIASFARNAPPGSRLLFKVHPIDNGLSRWATRISEAAERHGVGTCVFIADGGNTDDLIGKSAGVVTVNSTVGLTALGLGKPVITLGAAIYDVPGLTFQDSLAAFWQRPTPPMRICSTPSCGRLRRRSRFAVASSAARRSAPVSRTSPNGSWNLRIGFPRLPQAARQNAFPLRERTFLDGLTPGEPPTDSRLCSNKKAPPLPAGPCSIRILLSITR